MMAGIWSINGGVFLGFAADRLEGDPPPFQNPLRYADDRHICLIGPNGSGKTKRLLVPALHDLTGYSCVVNDIKGELCAMTEAHRHANGNQVIKLNPFNVNAMGSSGFNPIASLDLDDEFPDNAP
jgi:type IV secretion system protein VirD4